MDGTRHFVAVGFVSARQIRVFFGFNVTGLFILLGSSIPLNGFLRKIRQKTSFRVTKCLLKYLANRIDSTI